ncbi:MAG: alpha/beta hydrolase [Catenulispora sp.]|nr:alpha/beta hydrolase [Catenulispora sp.]
MTTFASYDGAALTYHESGTGEPLICLPGGPMRPSGYLGGLGGLSAGRRLVQLDLRGTGGSAVPADPGTCRIDRMVADVEALREHLGVERVPILGHSAGANLAMLYAEAHPEHVSALILVTPSTRAVDVRPDDDDTRAALLARKDEPWFTAAALEAYDRLAADQARDGDQELFEPFWHGRWDDAARRNAFAPEFRSPENAFSLYYAAGAFDPERTRAALAALPAPTLIVAGEADFSPTLAHLHRFADAVFAGDRLTFAVQPNAGHYPWEDDAARFTATVEGWLSES